MYCKAKCWKHKEIFLAKIARVYTNQMYVDKLRVCVNYRRLNAAALRVGVEYTKLNAAAYGQIQVMGGLHKT